MKKNAFLVVIATLFVLACASPVSSPNTPATGTSLNLANPGQVLKSIVIGKVDLPKSLQDGSTNSGAKALKFGSRDVGDVTTLTSLNLPSLKAEGYETFRDQVSRPAPVQMFLDGLKTSKAVQDSTLPVGAVTDLGTITMTVDGTISLTNAGKIRADLSADGNTLSIYWLMSYPDTSKLYTSTGMDPQYTSVQDFFDKGPRILIPIYILVQKNGSLQMYAKSTDMDMKFWTKYDPTTKESVLAETMATSAQLNLVQPQADGSFFLLNSSSNTSGPGNAYTNTMMGYANDSYGGVVTTGTSLYDDGSGTATSHPYLNVEYYDGNGDLVYQGWGNSGADASQWNWMASEATTAYNLPSKPTQGFQVRTTNTYIWDSSSQTATLTVSYQLSTDEGTTWTSFTPPSTFWGNYVYHDTSKDENGNWNMQPGDAQYYSSAWAYAPETQTTANGKTTTTWTSTGTYYKSFEVPTPETYFGQTYYVSKNYPLKNLLPLTGKYATGFAVQQKEGTTWWSWQDPDGAWQNDTTKPADAKVKTGTTPNSWTNYSYWLENTAYVDPTGQSVDSPLTIDTDKGDVYLNNISDMTVWYWNSATQQSVTRKAPAFYTYEGDLPPYFSVDQTKLNAAESTKSTLESFYAKQSNYEVTGYLSTFDSTMDSVAPLFATLAP